MWLDVFRCGASRYGEAVKAGRVRDRACSGEETEA